MCGGKKEDDKNIDLHLVWNDLKNTEKYILISMIS